MKTERPPTEPVATPASACEYQYIERLQANLRIAEQTLNVVQELDAGAAVERIKRTSLAVSIVIPAYNERDTIIEIVRRVQAVGIHEEIIVVDDFSLDGTRQLLVELDREPDVRVLMHGYNRGKGAALRTGFEQARGEVIAVQDADLEYDPNDLARLLEPIERGEADVVYGSRFLANARQDPSTFHRLGNRLLTAASNLTTGQRLTDMETCYKVFRREVFEAIEIEENRFGFEPEITAKLSRLGHRICELPISYSYRSYEEGKKIGWRDAARALWCIGKYGWGRN